VTDEVCTSLSQTHERNAGMVEAGSKMTVSPVSSAIAGRFVSLYHYLHRRPPISFAFALMERQTIMGIATFGIPASRHLQQSACPSDPDKVIELNRLWVHDDMPRNTETWFLARAIRLLPPRVIVSYADTAQGHVGTVYQAANFDCAGWTDMERKTPRFDYVVIGKHSRSAMREGFSDRVRRKPKVKYWTVSGNRREARQLRLACGWPSLGYESVKTRFSAKEAPK
jgi:hypothetical protein